MISVTVKDFGPIIEGAIELKPLTVFIGPNNSGKSHLATLVYALVQGAMTQVLFESATLRGLRQNDVSSRDRRNFYFDLTSRLSEPDDELGKEINAWIEKILISGVELSNIRFSDMPESFLRLLESESKELLTSRFVNPISADIIRCFSMGFSALSRSKDNGSKALSISFEHSSPRWHVNVRPNGDDIKSKVSEPSFIAEKIETGIEQDRFFYSSLEVGGTVFVEYEYAVASRISAMAFNSMYRQFPDNTHYLPAARTGILQGYKLLASEVVRNATGGGLSGVVRDFIGGMLTLEPGTRGELYEVAEFLEKKIARGQVYLEAAGAPYPEIYYEAQGQKYPMHRASSMVSELAPLILYLKHRLAPGDLLIFEEPESHLHPANQRILAHAIVKMVRKGVKVMLTTHSDYFLPQLGNFVRLSALEDERAKMGYDADDYLNPEDVGCYLFKLDYEEGGSIVRELEVSAAEGIVEDEFYDVGEALYNEYVDLEREAIKSSSK